MNKFRYNDPVERMKRVNRVYLITICVLFAVFMVYQALLVKEGTLPVALAENCRTVMILAVLIDCERKSGEAAPDSPFHGLLPAHHPEDSQLL